MDKLEYKMLKSTNTVRTRREIMNILRMQIDMGHGSIMVPVFAALGFWAKQVKSQEELIEFLDTAIKGTDTVEFCTRLVNENWLQIKEIARKCDSECLKATALFAEQTNNYGDYSTPEGLSKLVIGIMDIKKKDIVMNIGSGSNSFLNEVALSAEVPRKIVGLDINKPITMLGNIKQAITGFNISNAWMDAREVALELMVQAGKIFVELPFGGTLGRYCRDNQADCAQFDTMYEQVGETMLEAGCMRFRWSGSCDWYYACLAYAALPYEDYDSYDGDRIPEGKAIVLATNGALWNEADKEVRESMIRAGRIETIVSLPERLLNNTPVQTALIVMSENNEKIKLIDASKIYSQGRRQNTLEDKDVEKILEAYRKGNELSREVTVEEIAAKDFVLSPVRYMASIFNDEKLANAPTLEELGFKFSRGANIRSTDLDEMVSTTPTRYRYLMLKNIENGKMGDTLPYLKEWDERFDRNTVSNGDIVISKIAPLKIAVAEGIKKDEKVLANGNLYILKADQTRIEPYYALLYLLGDEGMGQLYTLVGGGSMRSISLNDLKKVKIPECDKEKQEKIVAKYFGLCRELKILEMQKEKIQAEIDSLTREVG